MMDNGFISTNLRSSDPLVENTASFDTSLNVIFCRMVDDSQFKSNVLNGVGNVMRDYMNTYLAHGAKKVTYKARNKVLMDLFEADEVGEMKSLDCEAKVLKVIEDVYATTFPGVIIKSSCNCKSKQHTESTLRVLTIDIVNDSIGFDFSSILRSEMCKRCRQMPHTIDLQFDHLIFFDTKDQLLANDRLPQVILLRDSSESPDRYIAHIKRSNQQWYTFDSERKKVSIAKLDQGNEMLIHAMCYIFPEPSSKVKSIVQKKPFEIIKNFHACYMNGMKININNSCGPDALLHILCNIYSKNKNLSHEGSSNVLVSLMNAYAASEEERVYQNRVKLLLRAKYIVSVNSFEEITINCDCNIYNAVKDLCLDTFPSATLTRSCECGSSVRNLSIIEIDMEELIKKGIRHIASCIMLKNRKQSQKCTTCKTKSTVQTDYGNVVFIDLQSMESSENRLSLPKITLQSIPETIDIVEEQYSLAGVVEYIPSRAHYIAHCHENADWIEYDDLAVTCKASKTAQIRAQLLVYIRD